MPVKAASRLSVEQLLSIVPVIDGGVMWRARSTSKRCSYSLTWSGDCSLLRAKLGLLGDDAGTLSVVGVDPLFVEAGCVVVDPSELPVGIATALAGGGVAGGSFTVSLSP